MTEQIEDLYKLQKKDMSKVGAILADAFQHDPVWNKVFKDEPKRDQKIRAFFETPIRYCLKYGEVYSPSENLEGIAAWVPGDLAEMPYWRVIRSGAIISALKMGAKLGKKMSPVFKQLDKDRKENMKERSFIYLQIIGVASKFQGQGFGGKMIRALIEKSERAGIPIYLETETEDNIKMYERFGFKVVKQITLTVINLPMWDMVREPSIPSE